MPKITIIIGVIAVALAAVAGVVLLQQQGGPEEAAPQALQLKETPAGESPAEGEAPEGEAQGADSVQGPSAPAVPELPSGAVPLCEDLCGDGICQEVVCLAGGCPCAETAATCPADCQADAPLLEPSSAPPVEEFSFLSQEHTIRYTDSGYSPQELTVEVGDTVTFKNESSRETWPASATHPTHRAYPNSDIQKCGTAEAEFIFDACGAVRPGEEWSFTFGNAGEWWYHDHLRPSNFGMIRVQ